MTTARDIFDKASLIRHVNSGNPAAYLFFWGPGDGSEEGVTRHCLCQWYEAPFALEGNHYPTAEHYMMAEKARLFGDEATLRRILDTPSPAQAKLLGRRVSGFDETTWSRRCEEIVVQGNIAKFEQNPALRRFLAASGERVLVEASPVDTIWGIGLAESDPKASDPNHWRGLNRLGFSLMRARQALQ